MKRLFLVLLAATANAGAATDDANHEFRFGAEAGSSSYKSGALAFTWRPTLQWAALFDVRTGKIGDDQYTLFSAGGRYEVYRSWFVGLALPGRSGPNGLRAFGVEAEGGVDLEPLWGGTARTELSVVGNATRYTFTRTRRNLTLGQQSVRVALLQDVGRLFSVSLAGTFYGYSESTARLQLLVTRGRLLFATIPGLVAGFPTRSLSARLRVKPSRYFDVSLEGTSTKTIETQEPAATLSLRVPVYLSEHWSLEPHGDVTRFPGSPATSNGIVGLDASVLW